jgi:hypothetical protein
VAPSLALGEDAPTRKDIDAAQVFPFFVVLSFEKPEARTAVT